jgi:hypothetical protein
MAKLKSSRTNGANDNNDFKKADAFLNIDLVGTKNGEEVLKRVGGIPLHLSNAIQEFLIENGESLDKMRFVMEVRSAEPAGLDEEVSFF